MHSDHRAVHARDGENSESPARGEGTPSDIGFHMDALIQSVWDYQIIRLSCRECRYQMLEHMYKDSVWKVPAFMGLDEVSAPSMLAIPP